VSLGSFDPMPPAVQARIRSDRAAWADRAATAYVSEGVAVDGVAVEQVGLDANAATLYGDCVECHKEDSSRSERGAQSALHNATPPAESAYTQAARFKGYGIQYESAGSNPARVSRARRAGNGEAGSELIDSQRELNRLAFLRRVQYVDPRERRA